MFCYVAGGTLVFMGRNLAVAGLVELHLDQRYQYWIMNENERLYYTYDHKRGKWKTKYHAKNHHEKHFICKREQEMQIKPTAPKSTTATTTTQLTRTVSTTTISNTNYCNNHKSWKMIHQMKYYISDVKMDYKTADDCCYAMGGYLYEFSALYEKMKNEFLKIGEQYWIGTDDNKQPYLTYDAGNLIWSRHEETDDTNMKLFICEQETNFTRAEIMLKTDPNSCFQGKPFEFKCILDVEENLISTQNIRIELLKNDVTVDNETYEANGFRYPFIFNHTKILEIKDMQVPWKCKAVIDEMILYSKEKILARTYTHEELIQKGQEKKNAIKIDKKSTALYRMKKISAEDKRPPAIVIGYVGIIFLSAIVLGIIACDASKFYYNYKSGGGLFPLILKRNVRAKPTKRRPSSQSGHRNSLLSGQSGRRNSL